jgi:SAM-dependent methyltransferase
MTKSYSSLRSGFFQRSNELFNLYLRHQKLGRDVSGFLRRMSDMEALAERVTGVRMRDLQALDVGCGQQMKQAQYLALFNSVTAIDQSFIPQGGFMDYVKLARTNGFIRAAKSAGRKVLGIDRTFQRELRKNFPDARPKPIRVMQMDATKLEFPDHSFDLVYSFSVFEHIPDPSDVVRDVLRVLKPGGVAYLGVHLYTSDSGCHDARILAGNRGTLPLWAHLRKSTKPLVQPNSFLNEWRLAKYEEMFTRLIPGVTLHKFQRDIAEQKPAIADIRRAGDFIEDYSDEELLTDELVAVWKKPR